MKFTICNVGILKEIEVQCNGVTLITGKNGSGKSTFGKTVSSLFVGIQNAPKTYVSGLFGYLKASVAKIVGLRNYDLGTHYYFGSEYISIFRHLYSILNGGRVTLDYHYYDKLLLGAIKEIEENEDKFINFLRTHNILLDEYNNIDIIINQLHSLRFDFEVMFFDKQKIELYAGQSISDELNYAFVGQVKPVNGSNDKTKIEFTGNNASIGYIFDDNIAFLDGDYSNINCFYIDDGSIVDSIYKRRIKSNKLVADSLADVLLDKLESNSSKDKVATRKKFESIFHLIDMVYPFDFVRNGKLVVTSNNGVNIANEASGRKIFALIKEMLYCNLINDSSILVFDEPDNHLHPKWQAIFAKLIMEISSITGCSIFCITHSPTLLLAFDVYARDENDDLSNNLNVYYCDPSSNQNKFADVSKNISLAHKQLADPYIDLDLFGKDAV